MGIINDGKRHNGKQVDLTEQLFNQLKVIQYSHNSPRGAKMWKCECTCGGIVYKTTSDLLSGKAKRCKNCRRIKRDITNMRFGRLIAQERVEDESHIVRWLCLCDCGKKKEIREDSLLSGATQSCGCLAKERHTQKHGMVKTRLYGIYMDIKGRCYNPNNPVYKHYGGRGIFVCEEWLGDNGFLNFARWSLNNGYDDTLTIDRIDVNGNYEPLNCRWVSWEIQCNNRRDTIFLTLNGVTKALSIWAKEVGIPRRVLYYRKTHGWDDESCLTIPVGVIKRKEKNKMNLVAVSGYLGQDVEVVKTQNDTSLSKFSLAVRRKYAREGETDTDWLRVICFGKTSDFASHYLKKGSRVIVEGRIQTGSYTNKEGNKVYTTDIVAESIEFAESKKSSENAATTHNEATQMQMDEFMNVPEGIEEELPFR